MSAKYEATFGEIPDWRSVVMQEATDHEIHSRFSSPEEAKKFHWHRHHAKPYYWERFNPVSIAILKAGEDIGLTHITTDNWLNGWLWRIRCYEQLLDRHYYFTEHDGQHVPIAIPSVAVLDHRGLRISQPRVPTRDFVTELRALFAAHQRQENL